MASLLMAGCVSPPVNKRPDPHHHTIQVHLQKSSPFHARDMESVDPMKVMARIPKDSEYLPNESQTKMIALGSMIHSFMGYPVPVVVLFDASGRSRSCFVSHTWPNRAIDRVEWIDDRLFTFDQFAGENLGWHYVVDSKLRKTIFATPFSDSDQPAQPEQPASQPEPAKPADPTKPAPRTIRPVLPR